MMLHKKENDALLSSDDIPKEAVPDVKFELGEVQDEEAAKLFAPIPTLAVKRAIYCTASVLIVGGAALIGLAGATQDLQERNRNIIMSVVMAVAGCMSIYSGYAKDRGGLQIVWLLNVWQMANGTKLIYRALPNITRLTKTCELKTDPEEKESCEKQGGIATGTAIVVAICWIFALTNAWLSSNLSEKIQDDEDLVERKRDIRFALAKQALSMRAQSNWKKAFLKVRAVIRWKKSQGVIDRKATGKTLYKFNRNFAK